MLFIFVQLKKWQQHMQEQLKAHQLVELLSLQEEQQGQMGMMGVSQHSTGGKTEKRPNLQMC